MKGMAIIRKCGRIKARFHSECLCRMLSSTFHAEMSDDVFWPQKSKAMMFYSHLLLISVVQLTS